MVQHIIYSNVIVSISCGMLSFGMTRVFGLENAFDYGLLSFFTTFLVYNFQRIVKHAQSPNPSDHMKWVANYQPVLFVLVSVSFFASGLLFFHVFQWSVKALLLLASGGIVSFFYIVRIGSKNLRELPHLKIHLISLTWVLIVGIFPLINEGINTPHLWWFAAIHYCYLIAVTIPFDIRDLKHDHKQQYTFPQVLGVNNAILLAALLLVTFSVLTVVILPALLYNFVFWIAIGTSLLLVLFTTESRPNYYFGGLIDGVIFLLGWSYCLL